MKGVAEDYFRDFAAAGCKLSSLSSRRAGTRRRRVIKSGADELLEMLEGAEEDEDEGDPVPSAHHRGRDPDTRTRSWPKRWWRHSSIVRRWASTPIQASGVPLFLTCHLEARPMPASLSSANPQRRSRVALLRCYGGRMNTTKIQKRDEISKSTQKVNQDRPYHKAHVQVRRKVKHLNFLIKRKHLTYQCYPPD